MANDTNEKRPERQLVTLTSTEFRADARAAIKDALAGKSVTVTDASGQPRMHIVRQTPRSDD